MSETSSAGKPERSTSRNYVMRDRITGRLYVVPQNPNQKESTPSHLPTPGPCGSILSSKEGQWRTLPSSKKDNIVIGAEVCESDAAQSLAIGNAATLGQGVSGSIALGHGSQAIAPNSIALGSDVVATQPNALFSRLRKVSTVSGVDVQYLPGNGQGEIFYSSCRRSELSEYPRVDVEWAHRILDGLRPAVLRTHDSKNPELGLVVEDVAEIEPNMVVFGPDNEPEGVKYRWVTLLILAEVQDLRRVNRDLRQQQINLAREMETRQQGITHRLSVLEKGIQDIAQQLETSLAAQHKVVQNLTERLEKMSSSVAEVSTFIQSFPDGEEPL